MSLGVPSQDKDRHPEPPFNERAYLPAREQG